jgi:hypothetical protein
MNGDLGTIYKAINEINVEIATIATKQEERHSENKEHLREIDLTLKDFETNGAGPDLGHDKDISRLYMWVWGIAIVVIGESIRTLL